MYEATEDILPPSAFAPNDSSPYLLPDLESSHSSVEVSFTGDEANRASPTLTAQSEPPHADVVLSNDQKHGRDQDEELDPSAIGPSIDIAEAGIEANSPPRKRQKNTTPSVFESP